MSEMAKMLKSTGAGGATWEQTKGILRDSAVDTAIETAKTDLHFKKLLEDARAKAVVDVIETGPRPEIRDGRDDADAKVATVHEDDSDDFSDLDDDFVDPELRKIEERRKEELRQQFKERQKKLAKGHGHFDELDEREMLEASVDTDYLVVAFYAPSIERCRIVDMHLARICQQYLDARFVKVNATKAPFVTMKWKVRTLPTICIVVKGYLTDKIIGFDDMGGADDFPTAALVRRLATSGVIPKPDGKRVLRSKRALTLVDVAGDDEDE